MPVNAVAEQVFGTLGTVCWTGQIIPQIWKSWREKATEGLSHWLMLIWGISSAFLGVFVIVQNLNIPLIIQPQLFGFFSLISWAQCLYYDRKKPLRQVILILVLTQAALGGFEAGMVFAIRPAVNRGDNRPVTFFGVMSCILLAAGLVPQYAEIIRFREAKGISMLFMTIDMSGGVFCLFSLLFKRKFDVLAGVNYILVVVLDGIVVILAIMLNPRAARRRKRLGQENADRESQTGGKSSTTIDSATVVPSGVSSSRNSLSHRTSLSRSEKPKDGEEDFGEKDWKHGKVGEMETVLVSLPTVTIT